ncbi:RNA polymerase sigma factor, sigma-70 family [Actinopolyspora mzabensis]|uniref:RNA polymerase sigma factor, sigma-70 family n=1 Tax=Actinopolyspora mzabensis TaxID=995066 RepID=A0A1G9D1E7_ACTMZ|nr:sigma-70 family RNA polymerase sigma factor [Actinopolyspora mzabensis]SDK57742.1 RNA polymerase sigma factor, sigma-70 family [Actinopolyspora mzabensis]
METDPNEFEDAGDNELIEAVRGGSTAAYGVLYERHSAAAHSMARQVANDSSEADDLVSEAFAKVLTGLRSGQGPNTAFRAYLLTAVRRTAYDRTRKERRVRYSADVGAEDGADVSVPFTDTAVAGLERSLAAQAFNRLPERWQTVLWHLEIEGESPSEVAPILGLTSNGVSALAYRAREGLRQAYLQVHLGQLDSDEAGSQQCRATADRLGQWTRGGLSKRESAQVDTHLDSCTNCRALAAELGDVNGGLRLVVAPFVLGTSAAGYLAGNSGTAAAAGLAAGGAGSTGAAGASGAASSLPRQIVGTTASAAAMVVAVALGLASGGQPPTPAAAAPPTSEQPTPRPEPPAPEQPSRQPRQPSEPSPPPRPSPEPSQPSEQPPPSAPEPGEPNLVASGPGQPVRLIAGGDPAELPLTIGNNGSGISEQITVLLALPRGISARVPGASDAAERSGNEAASTEPAWVTARSASARNAVVPASVGNSAGGALPVEPAVSGSNGTDPGLGCASEERSMTCTTERGLRPGEELRLDFRVRADSTARSGEVAVNITSAGGLSLSLAEVRVRVKPRTEPGITLTTDGWSGVFPWSGSRVRAHARNTGDTTGTARVVFELPEDTRAVTIPSECERAGSTVRCSERLRPAETAEFVLWLCDSRWLSARPLSEAGLLDESPTEWLRPTRLTVSAELAEARDSERVTLEPWWSRLPDYWDLPEHWDLPEPLDLSEHGELSDDSTSTERRPSGSEDPGSGDDESQPTEQGRGSTNSESEHRERSEPSAESEPKQDAEPEGPAGNGAEQSGGSPHGKPPSLDVPGTGASTPAPPTAEHEGITGPEPPESTEEPESRAPEPSEGPGEREPADSATEDPPGFDPENFLGGLLYVGTGD